MSEWKCKKCGSIKKKFGHCRDCKIAYDKKYYQNNKEKVKARVKAYANSNSEMIKEKSRKYYKRTKDKRRAYDKIRYQNNPKRKEDQSEYAKEYQQRPNVCYKVKARKRSRVLKPGPCLICKTKKDVERHHEDYSLDLVVVWLCETHHNDHKRKYKSKEDIKNSKLIVKEFLRKKKLFFKNPPEQFKGQNTVKGNRGTKG